MARILGFYSRGGAGHISVWSSVKQALLPYGHQLEETVPLVEDLQTLDPWQFFSKKKYDCEVLFNDLVAGGHTDLISFLGKAGEFTFRLLHRQICRKLLSRVLSEKPQLLISTMPYINRALHDIAVSQQIPLLMVLPDLYLKHYFVGLKRPHPQLFRLLVPVADNFLRQFSAEAQLSEQQRLVSGFAVRQALAKPIRPSQQSVAKQRLGIESHRQVIVVMMGGSGSKAAASYARHLLADLRHPCHLLICTGRNEELKKEVDTLAPTPYCTISSQGFISDIEKVLQAADLLISKPGGTTTMEGITLGLPMLLDRIYGYPYWEKVNLQFAQRLGAAQAVGHWRELMDKVQLQLQRPRRYESFVESLDFSQTLPGIVDDLLRGNTAPLLVAG